MQLINIMIDFDNFLAAMQLYVPEHAEIMGCQFRGDPNSDIPGKWRSSCVHHSRVIDKKSNVYLCVSAMKQNSKGEYRRRKENFAGGVLLMIDDLGEGLGAKFPMAVINPLPPTCLVETSPDNFQAMYFFDSLVEDQELFDALIRSFIERQFLGQDTGQAGVNRVFRPPVGINGKPKYFNEDGKPWNVKLENWVPGNRYSVKEIANAFQLNLVKRNKLVIDSGLQDKVKSNRIRAFIDHRKALNYWGMLKTDRVDVSGWAAIVCPWTDQHTDKADTGAAIRVPDLENQWFGAFRCHHAHCEGKGWRELTEWLSENASDNLANANSQAPDNFGSFK